MRRGDRVRYRGLRVCGTYLYTDMSGRIRVQWDDGLRRWHQVQELVAFVPRQSAADSSSNPLTVPGR